jgi:flavodoxin
MKSLVVFYSRTGNTKKVAEGLSKLLKSDLEEIRGVEDRRGVLGYAVSGMQALMKKPAAIRKPRRNPASYDVVVIGTPVWFGNVSTPVRTYLTQNAGRFKNVAFYCTFHGSGAESAFRHMRGLCGKNQVAVLALHQAEVEGKAYLGKVKKFAMDVKRRLR